MAFGFQGLTVSSGGQLLVSYTEGGSCNSVDLPDMDGKIIDQTTIGAAVTISTDYYLKPGDAWVNGATAGQTGSSVVTASALNATNGGYQHVTETKRVLPDYVVVSSGGSGT